MNSIDELKWIFNLFLFRKKNVKIVVIGVGKELYKSKEGIKKVAGKKETVLVYGNFDALINNVDDLLKATCGKLLFLPPYVLVQKYFDICLVKIHT